MQHPCGTTGATVRRGQWVWFNGWVAPCSFLSKLTSPQANWTTDTTGSSYRPKGYVLDESDRPTFRYQSYGSSVDDKIRVLPEGKGIQREVTITNPAGDLYARLISGTSITADGKWHVSR